MYANLLYLNKKSVSRVFSIPLVEKLKMRVLIFLGVYFMAQFLWWFFNWSSHQGHPVLYWLLTPALLFKMMRWLHEWYHYFFITVPTKPQMQTSWQVDMLTTYCAGEPKEMVKKTLLAMMAVKYPHNNYLCDEADDPELKEFCLNQGINHITRKEKKDAKAGNINNALKNANGDICVILDPDHVPVPEFLHCSLPYFEKENVGYVQCVQGYSNQADSLVAKAAAEQTYHFYGPLMMGMNGLGTVQAIGANCTFRRSALDSIGGHAAGLSEDMHTAMQLHAKGWKSVYVPEILSKGFVPSTLSAYYKQQLKWSRGTFELLFVTYPKLFFKFTLTQKIHYFFLPLYYLFGFITLIDILVPSISLMISDSPWRLDMGSFFAAFTPLFFATLFIRMYAQKWLAEKKERGFHILGGLLRLGTWWIYITGFFCTIFRVNIPYIPTPKDDEPKNEWPLALPNLALALFAVYAIYQGLKTDWTPFSLGMAVFAAFSSLLLFSLIILAQQKTLNYIFSINFIKKPKALLMGVLNKFYNSVVMILRKGAFTAGVFLALVSLVFAIIPSQTNNNLHLKLTDLEKDYGGFYTGIYMPVTDRENNIAAIEKESRSLSAKFDIVSIYQAWGPQSLSEFPLPLLQKIRKAGSVPMITWEPYAHNFPEFKNDKGLAADWKIFEAIIGGRFDKYITEYANRIREFGEPVMIRFAHEMDNPSYPWSFYGGGNTPEEFVLAHQYVVKFFQKLGAANVTWVWNPWEEDDLEKYYPGDDFVDWIGVTNLNYGLANSNGKWVSFEDLYKPFHDKLLKYQKPVMLSEFGCTDFGGNRSAWIKDAFEKISSTYTEIRSVVFFYSDEDKNWGATKWRPKNGSKTIDWTFHNDTAAINVIARALKTAPFNKRPVLQSKVLWQDVKKTAYKSEFVSGNYPAFELKTGGSPFYIKGVAYNVNQDWRDEKEPLTRKKLEQDFALINQMGANTIRRYGGNIYDDNVLNIANENHLKVLYGFWFDQDKNYITDIDKIKDYEEEVLTAVNKYKSHPALMGWALGNEVWGLLKHHYGQPYLTLIRKEYVLFIEQLAQKIHQADPLHPVFTVAENSKDLSSEFNAYFKGAPSIDVIGINSYYDEQISTLPNVQYMFDTSRPYLVSEYGPNGYWDGYFSTLNENGRLIENAGNEKAALYAHRWSTYIDGKKGLNVGGIAYTWQDRKEGTATWFGLTDYKGRLKPAYYALKEKWTGIKASQPVKDVFIYSPPEKLIGGLQATFYAITENLNSTELNYEWKLCSEEILEYKLALQTEEGGKRVSFTIPKNVEGLRLYLFVTGKDGEMVNTASIPILK
jgi:hypothetical protein